MIFPTVGLPGRFAELCEALLAELITAARATPAVLAANSLEDIGHHLLRHELRDAVVVVRQPQPTLCEALKAEQRPFVLVLDEPARCVAGLVDDLWQGDAPGGAHGLRISCSISARNAGAISSRASA
jgi:hypothetical protein